MFDDIFFHSLEVTTMQDGSKCGQVTTIPCLSSPYSVHEPPLRHWVQFNARPNFKFKECKKHYEYNKKYKSTLQKKEFTNMLDEIFQ